MREVQIPDKLYFKIGEVAELAGVEPYVLRYWESEFKEIGPVKSRTNQRLYRRKDIETVLSIKQLLYDEGFTIDGARKRLKETVKEDKSIPIQQIMLPLDPGISKEALLELKSGLREIRSILQK